MKLVKTGSPDEISLIYSLDNENWDDWNYSVGTTLKVGEKIFLKSKSEKQSFSTGEQNYLTFSSTNKFNACGNTMSLIYNDFIEKKSLTSRFCFLGLFQKSSIINVENLKLPATSLTYFCYGYMFDDCENLIYGPELPSEELAEWCYARMFRDCCVLRETPRLKSTGYMPNRCYSAMFQGCKAITESTELPSTNLGIYCYEYMFASSGLTKAPKLPATTLSQWCYSYMFWGCANLTEAPILSATTLQMGCYAVMFRYCTALTEIPKLPAETIPSWAYCYMFNGCVSLSEPVYLPAKLFYSTFCYAYMFDDCKLIKEIHYPISIESNSTFKSMNGTPWFGATDATVYYDL